MMKMAKVEKLIPALFLGLLIGAVGCSKAPTEVSDSAVGTDPVAQAASQDSVGAQGAIPAAITARSLTGVWLGEAVLDENKYQQKISKLNQGEKQLVSSKAKRFLSTVMAMEFRENGTVENEVEVLSTDGTVLRDGSTASWKILESKPNGLLVQTQERLADGSVASDQLFYQFSGDRNRIAIQIPVSQDLQGCDAMIVFERQTLPPTNVATVPTGTLTQ